MRRGIRAARVTLLTTSQAGRGARDRSVKLDKKE